jgi:hypothetical protein
VDRLSVKERERIAELLAEGAPFWRLCEEVHRSRHAIRRAVISLSKPPPRARKRSPLRLSPVEREEISRGLVAGLSLRVIAAGLGGRHRRCRVRWHATVVGVRIGRVELTGRRCGARIALEHRS